MLRDSEVQDMNKMYFQTCGIPSCSEFSIWLYVVLPASVALVLTAVTLGLCCVRQANKKPLSLSTGQ